MWTFPHLNWSTEARACDWGGAGERWDGMFERVREEEARMEQPRGQDKLQVAKGLTAGTVSIRLDPPKLGLERIITTGLCGVYTGLLGLEIAARPHIPFCVYIT